MKVSVAMVTYRHERFLAQAIESVLSQQTSFDFELVIGEDCSPDGTRAIAQAYAEKYPDRIRLHLQARNVGLTRNLSETIDACRGQYVAWLEGDDYWISPHKLQRQADYLDENLDCAWCFTRAIVVDADGNRVEVAPAIRVEKPKYTLMDYLERIFQPRACTVMFRHRLFGAFPEWFYPLPTADMPLHVLNAQKGDIGFVDEEMSAYRIHSGGVWSQGVSPGAWATTGPDHWKRQAERFAAMVILYETFQGYLGPEYQEVLRRQTTRFALEWTRTNRLLGDRRALRRSSLAALRSQPGIVSGITPTLLISLLLSFLPTSAGNPKSA